MVDQRRVRKRNDRPVADGPVVYWMQRDQRVEDNWALLYAQQCATERSVPLVVVFNLVPTFGETTLRHYDFMFTGLSEVEETLQQLNIPFVLLQGDPADTIIKFVEQRHVGHVVTDFNPLRFTDDWRTKVGESLPVRLDEVDAHNIIPCWVASDKQEFAAHTFRPKVHKQLAAWLVDFPKVKKQTISNDIERPDVDWSQVLEEVETDRSVRPVQWIESGSSAACKNLEDFCRQRLYDYAELRNDPNEQVLSNLSPYLHFGQISAQRVALTVRDSDGLDESKEAFLEELIVRRELTDNFCFYNEDYDKVAGAHEWAQKTIAEHANDTREYEYERKELEEAKTHDELWNAMQRQMVLEGKMHGWCRMYWAKKILEWTPNHQTAIDRALYLNDKYELDGTDPNGIVGVMWSICGVHDRAWTERPIFGKVRYMNYNGAKRKFDIESYIARYSDEVTLFDE